SYTYDLAWIYVGASSSTELEERYRACAERLYFTFADEGSRPFIDLAIPDPRVRKANLCEWCTRSLRPSVTSRTPGSRCATAPASPPGYGHRTRPRTRACPRSASTSRTASGTTSAAGAGRSTAGSPATGTRACASTCAAAETPTACCSTSTYRP